MSYYNDGMGPDVTGFFAAANDERWREFVSAKDAEIAWLQADWSARGSRIEELEKRIARMGEALKPFYDAATTITEEEALRARDGLTDFEYEKFDALNGEAK